MDHPQGITPTEPPKEDRVIDIRVIDIRYRLPEPPSTAIRDRVRGPKRAAYRWEAAIDEAIRRMLGEGAARC